MTEIEEIIPLIEYDIEEGNHISWYHAKVLLDHINSLITTIESQKEEIAELHKIIEKEDNVRMRNLEFAVENESLKAITELAVKGLKEIACLNVDSAYSAGTIARNTYSEIERLQNAQT